MFVYNVDHLLPLYRFQPLTSDETIRGIQFGHERQAHKAALVAWNECMWPSKQEAQERQRTKPNKQNDSNS
jgi:hypothetical protein